MKEFDENKMIKPSIGRFFETQMAIEHFEKNQLYVLPNADSALRESIDNQTETILAFTKSQNYINDYGVVEIEDELVLNEQSDFINALKSGDYNLLLQMNRPSSDKDQYLLAKSSQETVFSDICMMLNTAEQVSLKSHIELIQNSLKGHPGLFFKTFSSLFENEEFQKNLYTSGIHELFSSSYGMVPSAAQIQKTLGFKDGKATFKELNDMLQHLDEIVAKANREDEKAQAALTYILDSAPREYLLKTVLNFTPGNLVKFKNGINPSYYAASSPLQIYVCKPEEKTNYVFKKNDKRKNDNGIYQLFLEKGGKVTHVHFPHKNSFIVYLIYLIDRYRRDEDVDTIDLLDHEKLYKSLYHEIYPFDVNCDTSYNTLVSEYDENGEKRSIKLSNCISEIRLAVSNACESVHESPAAPHIIADVSSHIYTRSTNLHIPWKLAAIDK